VPSEAISVLLPVRDGVQTLDRAVVSVLASRDVDLELVCVDDGSTDGSAGLLDAWAGRDPRVRVLQTPPRGIVAALNLGLAAARAPLVARMDADDEMHPDRLALQATRFATQPDLALVGCQVESFRDGGLQNGYALYTEWVNGLVSAEDIARECFVECPIPHPTWMFRRAVVCALGGYADEPWPEDLDLLYRLLAGGHAIAKLPAVLYRWRDHDARLSRNDPRYRKEAFARAKAHYLAQLHPLEGAVVWGAGRTGRRFASLLLEEGVDTRAFIDINPARTGSRWRGIPILAPACVPVAAREWRDEGLLVLGAVSSRGARAQIRSALVDAGLEEGHDFLMVA
jgi:glycosyltransferase involved in cell wall biosynthesis